MKALSLLLCIAFNFFYLYGIRESSVPFISGDSFRAIAQHIYDETKQKFDPQKVKYKDTVFVKTDYLETFFNNMYPSIVYPFILITHNSDYSAPGKFKKYLNETKILYWLGQNPDISFHPKFIPIPIGIANRCWGHGNVNNFKKYSEAFAKNQEKKYLLGINFRTGTAPGARNQVYALFSSKLFCANIFNKDHAKYLELMAQTKFIISPPGNGLDCHRTWEALLVGTIPIVKSSTLDPLFADLPVVIITDWNQVTEEFLHRKYDEIQACLDTFDLEKIYFAYWKDLIELLQTS